MLSTQGFSPADVPTEYGDTLTFWDWKQRKVTQTVKLGPDGLIPLELRFLHDPSQPHGFVGAALSSNVIHFTKVSCFPHLSFSQHEAVGLKFHFWDWKRRKVTQMVQLGPDGLVPSELQSLHKPAQPHGFVGAALLQKSSTTKACCLLHI